MTVAAVLFTSSGHLEAGNRLEVHHLQHLLGLSVNLNNVLKDKRVRSLKELLGRIVCKLLNMSAITRWK